MVDFDFKKLARLDESNEAVRHATLTKDENQSLYFAMRMQTLLLFVL
jgi:hypothetical protein